jgi:hypothetical protein
VRLYHHVAASEGKVVVNVPISLPKMMIRVHITDSVADSEGCGAYVNA